ncbi:MAG: hypothetical protein JW910_16495 [Anaerolineae bacterium]|nr:hypothetical protein [Anaerolineae bacterium]
MKRYWHLPTLAILVILAFGGPGHGVTAQEGENDPDVFTIGAITLTSNYPEGMTFTIEASSSAGPITRATVFYDFGAPISGRDSADFIDHETGMITTNLYRYEEDGLIPWLDVNYTWRLVDAAGNSIETEPQHAIYEDTTREWMHAENDLVRVYWFGLPEWVGAEALDAVEDARERWSLSFPGVALNPPPLVVIYPDLESFLEWRGEAGAESIRFVGTLRQQWNGTVQRVADQERLDRECGGLDLGADYELVVRALARSTVVHELTHFHQYALSSDNGPSWWVEGQATFFEDPVQPYDTEWRVQRLAAMGELPSIAPGAELTGAGTLGPDGCTHVTYDVGASFLRFLRDNYGGYEAHGEIVQLVAQNVPIHQAIEQVTGRAFADLEAEWRATLGAGPVPTLMPTPTLPVFNFPTPSYGVPGTPTPAP